MNRGTRLVTRTHGRLASIARTGAVALVGGGVVSAQPVKTQMARREVMIEVRMCGS